MQIASYRGQDTSAWPGKISLVIEAGIAKHQTRELEQELRKSFTTNAVVFQGDVESQSDLPIVAKKMKFKNKLVRIDTSGTNPELIETLITRKVVDYISLLLKAPLYLEAYGDDFEKVRKTLQLIEKSPVKHEVVLQLGVLSDADVKDAASQVHGTLVLYADRELGEMQLLAKQLTGPKHIKIRNKNAEQSIS